MSFSLKPFFLSFPSFLFKTLKKNFLPSHILFLLKYNLFCLLTLVTSSLFFPSEMTFSFLIIFCYFTSEFSHLYLHSFMFCIFLDCFEMKASSLSCSVNKSFCDVLIFSYSNFVWDLYLIFSYCPFHVKLVFLHYYEQLWSE